MPLNTPVIYPIAESPGCSARLDNQDPIPVPRPSPPLQAAVRLNPSRVQRIKIAVLQYTPYLVRVAMILLITAAILGPLFACGITIPLLPGLMVSGISFSYFFTGTIALTAVSLLFYATIRLIKSFVESDQRKLQKDLTDQTINALTEIKEDINTAGLGEAWTQLFDKCDFSSLMAFYQAYDEVDNQTEKSSEQSKALSNVSNTLVQNVKGLPAYKSYSASIRGKDALITLKDFADFCRKRSHSFFRIHRNSNLSYLFWGTLYPKHGKQSLRCRYAGADYRTSMQCGNVPSRLWKYKGPNNKTIRFLIGPGTFDPVLDSYYRTSDSFLHIGMQHHAKAGEGPRVDKLLDFNSQERSVKKRVIKFANIPVDGNSWNMKPLQNENVSQFVDRYIKILDSDEKGYQQIGREITDEVGKAVKELFAKEEQEHITDARAQMIKYTFLTLVCLKMLQQMFGQLEDGQTGYVRIACKQSIDRGSTMTCAVNLLYHLAKGDLNQDMLHKTLGVFLGRSRLVENRLPIEHRIQPFLDMIDFFSNDNDQAKRNCLHAFLFPAAPVNAAAASE